MQKVPSFKFQKIQIFLNIKILIYPIGKDIYIIFYVFLYHYFTVQNIYLALEKKVYIFYKAYLLFYTLEICTFHSLENDSSKFCHHIS